MQEAVKNKQPKPKRLKKFFFDSSNLLRIKLVIMKVIVSKEKITPERITLIPNY